MTTTPNTTPSTATRALRMLGLLLVIGAIGWIGYLLAMPGWSLWKNYQAAGKGAHIPFDALSPLTVKFISGVIGLFIGVRLVQAGGKEKAAASGSTAIESIEPAQTAVAKAARRAPAKRWQSCNVLKVGADTRKLWNFGAGKGGFNLNAEQTIRAGQPLPANVVGRDWKTLIQPKLNIAWLPVDQVFLRVAQLPVSDFDETLAMVELQLEKLSPLPVTQIVWSIQVLPQRVDNLQTVIVVIMASDLVEKFLGDLEGQGFIADRLELPILDQLQNTPPDGEGAYIYPETTTGKFSALVAWWHEGTLRNVGIVHVPAGEGRDVVLMEQLSQMTMAGELEGWLQGEPKWHLIADAATAENWQPMFRPWLGHEVDTKAPLPEPELAALNANRAARADVKANILPPEYSTRYQQEFMDRLWMRGLGALLAVYFLGVVIYMAVASVQGVRAQMIEPTVAGMSHSYTNVLQLKAQLEILQNREALKFASLDCWKTTAELLPDGLQIGSIEFRDGKHLSLSGNAPGDQAELVTGFNEALRKATLNGNPMFDQVEPPSVRLNQGGATLSWGFSCDLANAEEVK